MAQVIELHSGQGVEESFDMTTLQNGREPPFSSSVPTPALTFDLDDSVSSHSGSYRRPMFEDPMKQSPRSDSLDMTGRLNISPVYINARYWSYDAWQPRQKIPEFVKRDLDVTRLNSIYQYLWCAGRQVPYRALHRWRLLGLKILPTEQADLHLVWSVENVFLKPLPLYLLNYQFWLRFICDPEQPQETYDSAHGFLLSYVWIIRHPVDFEIAKNELLLPQELTWTTWLQLVDSIFDHLNNPSYPELISARYRYGSLRLNRLDHIYRFAPRFRLKHLMDGYFSSYSSYGDFFKREFAWLVEAFAYISIVLTALQLGIQEKSLVKSDVFNMASYGLAIAALVLPASVLTIAVLLYIWVWPYHLLSTIVAMRRSERKTV